MHHIFVYSDSLTWGIIPDTRNRLAFRDRWPGVMEAALHKAGIDTRVTEDCLNGRRTVWEDPFKAGRKGIEGLAQKIECQSPLDLVILMLGTNDFQCMHAHTPWLSAQGIVSLITAIRSAPIEPGMPVPEILVVAPPPMGIPQGPIAPKFVGAPEKSKGLARTFKEVCSTMKCHFFDAGSVTGSSKVDGVHLDKDQHHILGQAVATVVTGIFTRR